MRSRFPQTRPPGYRSESRRKDSEPAERDLRKGLPTAGEVAALQRSWQHAAAKLVVAGFAEVDDPDVRNAVFDAFGAETAQLVFDRIAAALDTPATEVCITSRGTRLQGSESVPVVFFHYQFNPTANETLKQTLFPSFDRVRQAWNVAAGAVNEEAFSAFANIHFAAHIDLDAGKIYRRRGRREAPLGIARGMSSQPHQDAPSKSASSRKDDPPQAPLAAPPASAAHAILPYAARISGKALICALADSVANAAAHAPALDSISLFNGRHLVAVRWNDVVVTRSPFLLARVVSLHTAPTGQTRHAGEFVVQLASAGLTVTDLIQPDVSSAPEAGAVASKLTDWHKALATALAAPTLLIEQPADRQPR